MGSCMLRAGWNLQAGPAVTGKSQGALCSKRSRAAGSAGPHHVPRLLSVRTSLTLLVMEYVSSSGDMATISWMPPAAWLPEKDFPPREELARPSGCWFSLLLSSDRPRGSWEVFSGSVGLGGGDGEDPGSVGLAVGRRQGGWSLPLGVAGQDGLSELRLEPRHPAAPTVHPRKGLSRGPRGP